VCQWQTPSWVREQTTRVDTPKAIADEAWPPAQKTAVPLTRPSPARGEGGKGQRDTPRPRGKPRRREDEGRDDVALGHGGRREHGRNAEERWGDDPVEVAIDTLSKCHYDIIDYGTLWTPRVPHPYELAQRDTVLAGHVLFRATFREQCSGDGVARRSFTRGAVSPRPPPRPR
jgi:hypothetical protein